MYFLCKAHHRLLALKTTKDFRTVLGGHFKHEITNRKHKNQGTEHTEKRTPVCNMQAETRKQNISCSTAAENVCQEIQIFYHLANVHERPRKHWKYLFWGYKYILACKQIYKHGAWKQ